MQREEERPPLEVPQNQIQQQQQQPLPSFTAMETMAAAKAPVTAAVPAPPTIKNIAETDRPSAMDVDNNKNSTTSTSEERTRATSVLSIDDLEAAQALEGLRTGKFESL